MATASGWKKDISVAYRESESEDLEFLTADVSENGDRRYDVIRNPARLLAFRYGFLICKACFVTRPERDFEVIFDKIKKRWMRNQTSPRTRKVIKSYQIYFPVRSTTGLFQRELIPVEQ